MPKPKSGKVGRPSTYTEAKGNAICDYLREGNSWPDSCALAGVPDHTARGWKDKQPEFSEGVEKARAGARRGALLIVKAGQNGQTGIAWQSAAWFLERSDFEHWGRKERVEQTGRDGGPIVVTDKSADEAKSPSHNGTQGARDKVLRELRGKDA